MSGSPKAALACRPMLCFAAAAMAGVLAGRFQPGLAPFLPYGWLAFLVCALAYAFAKPCPAAALSDTPYARHIRPVPGALARRGLNRFILLASFALFLLGFMRQGEWRASFEQAGLPEAGRFRAALVAGQPNRAHHGDTGRWRVPATLRLVDGAEVPDITVRLLGDDDVAFRRGDIIEADVRLLPARPKAFPGAFDSAFFRERDGAAATLAVVRTGRSGNRASSLEIVPVDSASPYLLLRRAVDALRGHAIRLTLKYGGGEGGMLAAMLYGHREDTAAEIVDAFCRVGIGHILAISGLHVGMIVGLLWWTAGRAGLSRRRRAVLCILLSLFYLGLSGGAVAATRATLMADIHLAGIARGRGGDMLNSLGAAALIIVLINPAAPLDVSFQLSFTAVVFLAVALRRLPQDDTRALPDDRLKSPALRRLRSEAWSLFRLSAATSLGLFPIIAIVFNQVNVVGLFLNILVVPMMSLVLAGGLLLPWLGWIPGAAWLLTLLGRWVVSLAMFCDTLPGSSFAAHSPAALPVAAFYLFVCLWMMRPMVSAPRGRRLFAALTGAGACLALAAMAYSMRSLPAPSGGRIVLLPGGGMGSMVVEAANGDVAVLGEIRRGGLLETEWLHYVRRGSRAAAVAAGRERRDALNNLDYHFGLARTTFIQPSRKAEAGFAAPWQPVPGAEAVEYAWRRDSRGRLFWLSARTGGVSGTIVSRISVERFAALVEGKAPGSDADVFSLGFSDAHPALPAGFAPSGVIGVRGRMPDGEAEAFFRRAEYGAVAAEETGAAGFDGKTWVPF